MLRMLPAGHRQRIRFALTREPPSPHLKIQLEFRRGPNLKFSTGPQTGPNRRTSTIGNPVCIMSRLQLVKNARTVPRSSASRGICTAKYHIIAILSIPREGNHPTHRLDGGRLGLKVVASNLLPARQVCLVERHGHTVGQANTPKPDHTVVRLTLNRSIKPSSGGNWVSEDKLPSAISPARTDSTRS